MKNTATTFRAPVRDPEMPLSLGPGHAAALDAAAAVALLGRARRIWDTRVNNHNSMLDAKGRLWLAATVRGPDNPAFCKAGSDHPSAKAFPMDRAVRHLAVFDPEDAEVHVRRHLLLDAPSAVRLRRQRHAVDERRRAGGRLAEHEDVPRDRRCGEVAGLDGAHPRHQRQRQSATTTSSRTSRSTRRRTSASTPASTP